MKSAKVPFLLLSLLITLCASEARAQLTFDKPKTEPPLANPYTLGVPREQILDQIREVLRTCDIKLDENLSRPREGKLVTLPVIFARGVTAKSDIEHLATMPAGEVRDWQQGRYVLEITALPLDQKRSQLAVVARIEGRVADAMNSNKWIEGQSNGTFEDDVIRGFAGKILGIDLTVRSSKSSTTKRRILNCEY